MHSHDVFVMLLPWRWDACKTTNFPLHMRLEAAMNRDAQSFKELDSLDQLLVAYLEGTARMGDRITPTKC